VWRLRGKLVASQRLREDLTRQEALARSQIKALMTKMTSLKDMMAVQETMLISLALSGYVRVGALAPRS
jgi:hypothetical protein